MSSALMLISIKPYTDVMTPSLERRILWLYFYNNIALSLNRMIMMIFHIIMVMQVRKLVVQHHLEMGKKVESLSLSPPLSLLSPSLSLPPSLLSFFTSLLPPSLHTQIHILIFVILYVWNSRWRWRGWVSPYFMLDICVI